MIVRALGSAAVVAVPVLAGLLAPVAFGHWIAVTLAAVFAFLLLGWLASDWDSN